MTGTPRWIWLLPIVAMVAWWPIGPYWQSDDFIAVQYASDLSRASSDLIGKQYGATDIWAFYRPLITLSFWFDQTVAGIWPPFGHCSNVVAHGISTLLVALIWRRFLGDRAAFGAALLWSLMPGHVGSIAWGVGRVDSHTTVWCLLAIFLCLRANEQRASGTGGKRWPMVAATLLALMSKELAFVVAPLCTWLSIMQSHGSTIAARVNDAFKATWPVWLLFALYLPFRLVVFGGEFGGYAASNYEPQAMIAGIGTILLDLLVPLRWIGMPAQGDSTFQWVFLIGAAVPVAIAVLLTTVRQPRMTLLTLIAFLVSIAPMATFLTANENPHNLRYYYLPTIAVVGLLAHSGRWLIIATLLAWLCPLVAVRKEQYAADQQSKAMHAALLDEAAQAPQGPMFVAGMPHKNAKGTAVQLHFGVDRMLQPPFSAPGPRLYALRTLLQEPGVIRIESEGEAPPFAVPGGSTWWFQNGAELSRITRSTKLAELVISGDVDGVLDLKTDRLLPLIDNANEIKTSGSETFGLTTQGVKQPFFRLTLFTANGYLSSIFKDHSKPDATSGRIDVFRLLDKDDKRPFDIARLSTTSDKFLGDALEVPTTIDMSPSFPALIEAGDFDMGSKVFTATHRAQRLIEFRFDRSYPAWVRKAQGTGN